MSVRISAEKCISCGACAVLCPCGAIHLHQGIAQADPALCTNCLRCICKCYGRAIRPGTVTEQESECFL